MIRLYTALVLCVVRMDKQLKTSLLYSICHYLKQLASHKVSVCVYLWACVRSVYMDHTLSGLKSL